MIEGITIALGKLFGMGEKWVKGKQAQALAKVEGRIKKEKVKVEAECQVMMSDAQAANNIDLLTVKNRSKTWTDELVVVTLLSPLWCMFIPPLQPYVESGFKAFSGAPEWYQYCFYGVVISELGLRRITLQLFETLMTFRTGRRDNARKHK